MPDAWFYHRNGEQHGPVSSGELKELANTGQLSPADQIWKEGMEQWQPASRLKGLTFAVPVAEEVFPDPEVNMPANLEVSKKSPGAHTSKRSKANKPPQGDEGISQLITNPVVVGLSLLFCFPVGLVLVWRHPDWSRNQKLIWTGALLGLMVLGAMLPDSKESPNTSGSSGTPATANGLNKPSGTDYDRGYQEGFERGSFWAKRYRQETSSAAAQESIMGVYQGELKAIENTMMQMVTYRGEESPEARFHTGRYNGMLEGFGKGMR